MAGGGYSVAYIQNIVSRAGAATLTEKDSPLKLGGGDKE